MFESTTRACAFAAAVATTIVGVVHAINSFRGAGLGLRWSSENWFGTCNESFQEAFLLTPYQIAKHWQPLILGLIALGHHVRIVPNSTWRVYSTWQWAAIFHILLAFFGNAGWAGNLGICAACVCLLTSFFATCMACQDRDGRSGSLSEPLFG